MMRKIKILLDASPWAGSRINEPYDLLGAFFDFAHLDQSKEILNEMIFYSSLPKSISEMHDSTAITMYTAFHSLLRTAYVLNQTPYTLIEQPIEDVKHLNLGSLNKEEFINPFIVFQNAFDRHSLEDFDVALYEMLYFSMSVHFDSPDSDLLSPYIHITKILDASWLVYQRGIKKNKKSFPSK